MVREPLRDQNYELSIAWEHSYLPHDDFGAHTYKTAALYEQQMLRCRLRLDRALPAADVDPRQPGGDHGVASALPGRADEDGATEAVATAMSSSVEVDR